jgi:hypothetical protein
MPERVFAPPPWTVALVVASLLGGASALLDAWSQVADDQSTAARRGAVVLALALVALVAAAPEGVAHLKTRQRGPRRLAAVGGFVAFDVFLLLGAWRWRRGLLVPVPEAVVVATALVSLVLLVLSARSVAGSGARQHDLGRDEWG